MKRYELIQLKLDRLDFEISELSEVIKSWESVES